MLSTKASRDALFETLKGLQAIEIKSGRTFANDFVLYNTATGVLSYDADGNAAVRCSPQARPSALRISS